MSRTASIGKGATRREIMRRGALFIGAVAVGSRSFGNAAPTADAGVPLAPERRRAFTALIGIVLTGRGMRLGDDAVQQAVGNFDSAYRVWPAAERERANRILDALSRKFSGRGAAARIAALTPSAENPGAAQLAYDARSLMAVALDRDGSRCRALEIPV